MFAASWSSVVVGLVACVLLSCVLPVVVVLSAGVDGLTAASSLAKNRVVPNGSVVVSSAFESVVAMFVEEGDELGSDGVSNVSKWCMKAVEYSAWSPLSFKR